MSLGLAPSLIRLVIIPNTTPKSLSDMLIIVNEVESEYRNLHGILVLHLDKNGAALEVVGMRELALPRPHSGRSWR